MNLKKLKAKHKKAKDRKKLTYVNSNLELALLDIEEETRYSDGELLKQEDKNEYDVYLIRQAAKTGNKLPYQIDFSLLSAEQKASIRKLKPKEITTKKAENTLVKKVLDKKSDIPYKKSIQYKNGFVTAITAHGGVRIEMEYEKSREGKNYSMTDIEMDFIYPNVKEIIPTKEDKIIIKDNVCKLVSYLRGISKFSKNFRSNHIYVQILDNYYNVDILLQALYPMIEYGEEEVTMYFKKNTIMLAESGEVTGLACPIIPNDIEEKKLVIITLI